MLERQSLLESCLSRGLQGRSVRWESLGVRLPGEIGPATIVLDDPIGDLAHRQPPRSCDSTRGVMPRGTENSSTLRASFIVPPPEVERGARTERASLGSFCGAEL